LIAIETDEYGVVVFTVLIELAMLDAVVDDFRVDSARTQVGEHAAVVIVSFRQDKGFRRCPCRRGA
jgi:hypothetical protein